MLGVELVHLLKAQLQYALLHCRSFLASPPGIAGNGLHLRQILNKSLSHFA